MAQEHSPSPTPSRAVYGFVLYLASFVGFGLYIVWAYVPDAWLNAVGLTYWPQKHWAVTLPIFLCFAIVIFFVSYTGLIVLNTPSLTDVKTITDHHAIMGSVCDDESDAMPPLRDLDISTVNQILYGTKKS